MAQKIVVNPAGLASSTVPLSRGMKVGDLLFVSGTVASPNPSTGTYDPDIRSQVRSCLENIGKVLEEGGTSFSNVVSVITHLKDKSMFADYNDEYRKFFPTDPPARTTVETELIRPELLIEITSIAVIPS